MGAAAILQLILTYGPGAVTLVQNLVTKLEAGDTVTLADVEAQFAGMQPYAAYGIRQAGTPQPTAPPAA
jgi:hypothetical protein